MADTPDTPQPSKATAPRRRAPRKSTAAKPAGAKGASKAPAKAPEAAKPKRTRAASASTATKPAAKQRAAGRKAARPAPPKPASKPSRAEAVAASARSTLAKATDGVSKAREKLGGKKWGTAAIAGSLAAVGAAATAALLSLRGSTPKGDEASAPTDDASGPVVSNKPTD